MMNAGGGGSGAFGSALGNLKVLFRPAVRAASGPALGNLKVLFRPAVRATSNPRLLTAMISGPRTAF
jgi:hypothetical protein